MAFVSVTSVLALFVQTNSAFAQGSDDVRLNRAIELLAGGEPAFGVFSADYSMRNARTLARSNLDFVIIDMEPPPVRRGAPACVPARDDEQAADPRERQPPDERDAVRPRAGHRRGGGAPSDRLSLERRRIRCDVSVDQHQGGSRVRRAGHALPAALRDAGL